MAADDPQSGPESGVGLPILYANWVRAVPGPLDLALDYGYIAADTPQQPAVRVVMTWEYAKLLQKLLNAAIEQREGNVGEIELPPGVTLTGGMTGNQPAPTE